MMTQYQLDFAAAEATGESLETIMQFGFVPLTEAPYERERCEDGSQENEEQEDDYD